MLGIANADAIRFRPPVPRWQEWVAMLGES